MARAPPARCRPGELTAAELPAGALRERLESLAGVRALTPIARIRSELREARVLDGEGKTVVRHRPGGAAGFRTGIRPRLRAGRRARLRPGARSRPAQRLGGTAASPPPQAALADDAVLAAGGTPGGAPSTARCGIDPGDPAHRAVAAVLEELRATIDANLPGVLADLDTEFLHDLRVAVRRTRSVQRELEPVFPPESLEQFRAELRWVQQVTGPTRDLDVYLLEFDELRRALPAARSTPTSSRCASCSRARRRREQRQMVRALRSARSRRALLTSSATFVEPARQEGSRRSRPEAGGRSCDRRRRGSPRSTGRWSRRGRAINDASPAEDLHELRKKGKELRYLLELFARCLPADPVKPLVSTLKALQDVLGRFQDREVQAEPAALVRPRARRTARGPAALMAMGLLVAAARRASRPQHASEFASASPRSRRKDGVRAWRRPSR